MRFYWLKGRQEQQQFDIYWAPDQINLADYFTKNHPLTHSTTQPLNHSPTNLRTYQELHQSYLEAAHAFSEQGGQQKKRSKK